MGGVAIHDGSDDLTVQGSLQNLRAAQFLYGIRSEARAVASVRPFKPALFLQAHSPTEALDLLERYPGKARIVGGNTFLNELSKRGLLADVQALIDIEPLGLSYLHHQNGDLTIGGSTRLQDVADDPRLHREPVWKGLAEAACEVHPLQVRNMATVAGCISTGVPFLDVPAALLALEAKTRLYSRHGEEEVPIEDYLEKALTDYMADRFIKEVVIPKPNRRSASAFKKLGLTASDYAIVNAATKLTVNPDGLCASASIAVGGKGIDLLRMKQAEGTLQGKPLVAEVLASAAEKAAAEAAVTEDIPIRGSADYKRHVIKVMVNRTLMETTRRLGVSHVG